MYIARIDPSFKVSHYVLGNKPSVAQSLPYGWNGDEVSGSLPSLKHMIIVKSRPYRTSEASIMTCIMTPWKMTAYYSHRLNPQYTKYKRPGNTVSSNWCKPTDRRKPWHRVEALQMEQNTQFRSGLPEPIHLFIHFFMFLSPFVKPSCSPTLGWFLKR